MTLKYEPSSEPPGLDMGVDVTATRREVEIEGFDPEP